MNKHKKIVLLLVIVSIIMAIFLGISLTKEKTTKIENIVEENPDDKYIIPEDFSLKKDENGNYIYPEFSKDAIMDYDIYIPKGYREKQRNKCIKELLEKTNEFGSYTCESGGYKYVAISSGLTRYIIYPEIEPIVIETDEETNEETVMFRYRFVYNTDVVLDEPEKSYKIYQLPTDKKVLIKPLQYVENGNKFDLEKCFVHKLDEFGQELDELEYECTDEEIEFYKNVDLFRVMADGTPILKDQLIEEPIVIEKVDENIEEEIEVIPNE